MRPARAFSVFTGALLFLLAFALAFGLLHESSEPMILGRYSAAYAVLLLAIATAVGILAWLLVTSRETPVRWAQNAYTLLVSTAVMVVATETALRLVNPLGMEFFSLLPFHMQGMVDHAKLGYEHPRSVGYVLGSNRVSLNSHGQRDDEIPVAKPVGERRILVLGDSVTFGWGVDQGEDFPARLEALLRESFGRSWQVINAGVNGYNSAQEAIYFSNDGIRFRPDIVLLVYVGNDADPIIDPNAVTWRRFPNWPSSLPELLDRIRSVSYLYQATKLMQRMEETGERAAGDPPPSATDHPGWPASLAALRSIATLCARESTPFLVVMLAGSDPRAVTALKEAGIEATSFGPAWSRVAPEHHYVSRLDPHPSAAVHLEFARQLVQELSDRGWLATESPRPAARPANDRAFSSETGRSIPPASGR